MASTSHLQLSEHEGDITASTISLESISSEEMIGYSTLTKEEIHMAKLLRVSRDKTSWRIPFLFVCSSLLVISSPLPVQFGLICSNDRGKLILGFSTSLAIKGHYDENRTTFIVGVVLAVLGLLGCIAAALGFGAAASKVNAKRGLIFK